VALFAGATGKGRHPQSSGDGETGRAHAISNVQELATRGKLDEQEDPKREAGPKETSGRPGSGASEEPEKLSPAVFSGQRRVDCSSFGLNLAEVKEMALNITPLHDRVVVRRLEEKETAKGGIIIPDTAKEKPQEGEVMAVGAGKMEKGRRIPLDVKVGDRILFGKYTGSEIKIDDQEYLIFREEEILAKVSGMAKAASGKK